MSCVIFRAAGHPDAFSIDERIGNLASGFVQVAPRGLTENPEFFCRFFLFEPFEIDEPDKLDLIGLERDSLSLFFGTAAGFVTAGFRAAGYGAPEL